MSANAIYVACGHCGALRGEPCARRSTPHVARVKLWQKSGCPGPAQMPKGRATRKSERRRRRSAAAREEQRQRQARRDREATERLTEARAELRRQGL